MGGRNYRRGRAFEYRVKHHLEKHGCFVVRSASSHGPADLVALKEGKALLVQCKMRGNLSKVEKEELIHAASLAGADCCLAYLDPYGRRREIVLWKLNPLNPQTSREMPCNTSCHTRSNEDPPVT